MSDYLKVLAVQRGDAYALDVAVDDLKKVRAVLEAKKCRVVELEGECASLSARLSEMEGKVAEAKAEAEKMREELERLKAPRLARNQPCGCVVCNCNDPTQCHGCGAKNCGTHPPGEIPNPVYENDHPVIAENKILRDRAEDVEGMAKVMYAHEHEKLGTRWEDEPRSIKSYWNSAARAVSRWLKGE